MDHIVRMLCKSLVPEVDRLKKLKTSHEEALDKKQKERANEKQAEVS